MAETWLTADEVEELTGLKRWKAQCRKLAEMGIPFRPTIRPVPATLDGPGASKDNTRPARIAQPVRALDC